MVRDLLARGQGFARTCSGICSHVVRDLLARIQGFARTWSGICSYVFRDLLVRGQGFARTWSEICSHVCRDCSYCVSCGDTSGTCRAGLASDLHRKKYLWIWTQPANCSMGRGNAANYKPLLGLGNRWKWGNIGKTEVDVRIDGE